MENKVKYKMKEKIDRLRRKMKRKKTEGDPKITGVDKPKKKPSHAPTRAPKAKAPRKDKTVAVGPKGGKFVVSPGGKKKYERMGKSELIQDTLTEVVDDNQFSSFFENFKNRSK